MRILIIANPLVGIKSKKKAIIDRLVKHIKSGGGTVDTTYIMKSGIGKTHASKAALEGYHAVYAAGGDGTVNEVASGLVGRTTPMGIIPLGTGNGLARGLGMPFDTEGIIATLLHNKTTTIDIGKIASRYFFSTAGIGFDAYISRDFNRKRNIRTDMKWYVLHAVKNYFTHDTEELKLVVDGKVMERTVFGLTVCNSAQYGVGALIAPQADLKSGKLIAALIPKYNVFKALPAINRLFRGALTEDKNMEYITFRTLIIKRHSANVFQADGDAFEGEKTLTVSVIPSSLHVIVP